MKRPLAGALVLGICVVLGRFWKDVPVAQAGNEECAQLLEPREGVIIQDIDGSGGYNPLGEAIHLLNWHFLGREAPVPPCPDPRIAELEGELAAAQQSNSELQDELTLAQEDLSTALQNNTDLQDQLAAETAAREAAETELASVQDLLTGIQAALNACIANSGCALPRTGQTTCYDGGGSVISCGDPTYPGQDGSYRAGCSMQDRFLDNTDGTVTDTCTGFVWQKTTPPSQYRWQEALNYCENLELAGHSDWKLPNIRELESIIDYARAWPEDVSFDPIFEVLPSFNNGYWSSSSYATNSGDAWRLELTNGIVTGIGRWYKTEPLTVRAVRNVAPCGLPEICDNSLDDNDNGLIDCEDPDCSDDAACPEICDNTLDDDADGLTDCEDPECSENAACPEICDNTLDDDADGLTDCEDPDCRTDPACIPETCDNTLDDDADGLTDCQDPECSDDAACPETCDNSLDDDADGLIDCEDPECSGVPPCPAIIPEFTFTGSNPQGYPEYTHDATGIVFVRLPGGTFNMGSPETECERQDEEGPVHQVTLSPFLIAKYEVNQPQWEAVMGGWIFDFRGDNLPADKISWHDVQLFEARTGLTLPTEAQWEYACRAGTQTPFAFGNGQCLSTDQANYNGNFAYCEPSCFQGVLRDETVPVDAFEPNGFGLHNMHGNVWEWCEDWYKGDFYAESQGATDPLSTTSDHGRRVLRGGSWHNNAGYCRSGMRGRGVPSNRPRGLGFRPAMPVP